MNEKCSYDAIVDLSALDLDTFIQGNISEAVEYMEKAHQDGDYSYICSRIQSTLDDLKKQVLSGQKDSVAKSVKALHNAVMFIDWGVRHHLIELCGSEGQLLPWVDTVVSTLNFMSLCHVNQEQLTDVQVQQLYDLADVIRKNADLSGIKLEVSPRLQPPQLDGEGVHVRLLKKNGKMTSCSETEYFKYRVKALSAKNSSGKSVLKAFFVFILATALCYGAAVGLQVYVKHSALESLKVFAPAAGCFLAVAAFLFSARAANHESAYFQSKLAELYKEWRHSPAHGTVQPLDNEFTKLTGVVCGSDNHFSLPQ